MGRPCSHGWLGVGRSGRVPGPVGLGLSRYKDRPAVGHLGWVPGKVEPGRLGSEGLSAPYQLGWVPGMVESRALVSVGGSGVGRKVEGQGPDQSDFQGLPGVGRSGRVSGPVDLGRPGSRDWFV